MRGSSPSLNLILVLQSVDLQWRTSAGSCHVPLWVRLELSDMVDRAQQPGRDEVSPTTPGLGGARVLYCDVRVCVHCHGVVSDGREVLLQKDHDDLAFDPLGVRLLGTVCGRLNLGCT